MIHYTFFLVALVPTFIYWIGSYYRHSFFEKVAFILLLFISSLAYNVGGDYSNYYIIYNKILHGDVIYQNEPLFYFLNKAIINLGLPFNTLYLISHAFLFLTLYKLFNSIESNYRFVIFGLFMFSFDAYWSNLIYLRQEIAMTFLIISIKYIVDQSKLKFLSLIIIGSLFHNILLIFLPIYFLKNITRSQLYLVMVAIFSGVYFASFTIEALGLTKYMYYLVRDYHASLSIGYFIKLFIFIVGLYLFDRIRNMYFTLFLVGQFIALCEPLLPLLFRVEVIFSIFHIYGLTLIIVWLDKRYNMYLVAIIILAIFTYNMLSLNRTILKKEDHAFWDRYKLIIFENDDLKGVINEDKYRKRELK